MPIAALSCTELSCTTLHCTKLNSNKLHSNAMQCSAVECNFTSLVTLHYRLCQNFLHQQLVHQSTAGTWSGNFSDTMCSVGNVLELQK